MFERPHHQRIARVLQALDGAVLRAHSCLFGGGTAIALRFGEYRESVDMDFLVSDLGAYRQLRVALTGASGFAALVRPGAPAIELAGDVRADQYGIRARVLMDGHPIKFEIVHEARITLVSPGRTDALCGIPTLTVLDMASSKLLANADRWLDDGVFSRDLIDLAMMRPVRALLREALTKAEGAYGEAIQRDLVRAIEAMRRRTGWLERCIQMMDVRTTPSELWQRIRQLRRAAAPGFLPRP